MKSNINILTKINKAVIIYVLFGLVMIWTVLNKTNLHVDEILSYILANNVDSVSLVVEEGYTYASADELYLDNIAVNSTYGQFNFQNVWENQANDVHPPLYYLFLHIICSFNVGKFSIWYAAVINIIFALLTLYVLRKLMFQFVDNKVFVNFASVVFVILPGILQNVSFLRMYVMAMFWVTLIAYLFVKAFEGQYSWKLWMQMGCVALLSALTHYYCIIYLCATCLIFGICLIVEKRWKDIGCLVIFMTVAGTVAVTIFPAMLTHMFFGYRGTQSIDNLANITWNTRWDRLKNFYGFINGDIFGKCAGWGILFLLAIVVLATLLKNGQDILHVNFNKRQFMKWMISIIPIIIYFLFVSLSAAYVTDRYLFPIYAVSFAMFLCAMISFWKRVVSETNMYIILCLLFTSIIVNGWSDVHWNYLYKDSLDLFSKAQNYLYKSCIYVYEAPWKIVPSYYELKNYDNVTCISQGNINALKQYSNLIQDGFVLSVHDNDENIIKMIKEIYPHLDKSEKIGSYGYSTSYYIYSSGENHMVKIFSYDKKGSIGADVLEQGSNVSIIQSDQKIWLVEMGDNDEILIEMDGQVIDVERGVFADGTNIQLFPFNGSGAQKWKCLNNDDSTYSFLINDGKYALTCGEDGNIFLAEYQQGLKAQCWWVEQIMY